MSNDYFDDTYTPGFTDPIDNRPTVDFLKDAHSQLRETMKEAYEPNKLKTQTEFEAICLMQLNNTAELDMPFVRIKARVPELHTMLPIPASITDYRAISLYPTYTCRNNDFEIKVVNGSVAPGTRMRVSYENMANFAGPKIIGISNILNLGNSGDGADASNRLAERRRQDRSNTAASGTRRVECTGWCASRTTRNSPSKMPISFSKADGKPAGSGRCGGTTIKLLNPVADEYEKAYAEVYAKGGIITTAGGYRHINAILTKSRSATSFHYTARAFDMAITSGMAYGTGDLTKDAHVVVRDPAHPRKWIVWAKVMNPAAPGAASVPNVTLNAFERNVGRAPKTTAITGKYFNLTDIFKKYGFERIGGLNDFWTSKKDGSGNYMSSEWWHFQNVTAGGGIPPGTTWGEVLLQQYSLEYILASNYNKLTKTQDPANGVHTSFRYTEKETPWQYQGGSSWR